MQAVGGLEAVGPRVLQVLLDLEQQVVAPARRPALRRQGRGPVQAAGVVVEEEAVDRVQHPGGAGQAGRRRPQEAALGVVGVEDVVAAAAHGAEQVGGAAGVGQGRDLALEGLVVDLHAEAGEGGLVVDAAGGAGVGGAAAEQVDLVPGVGQAPQPAAQQQVGDAVRGDHVGDAGAHPGSDPRLGEDLVEGGPRGGAGLGGGPSPAAVG